MRAAALVLAALLGLARPAVAQEHVDLALVLAVDVSRSIDDAEFELQRKGYAQAFMDPRVLQAIRSGPNRGIAVAYVEWAEASAQKLVVDWTVIRDDEAATAFSERLLSAPRSFRGWTSISAAIDFAVNTFDRASAVADRRAIDVSGDGTNNSGREVTAARDDALAAGITINGLAIINDNPSPGAFSHVQPPEGLPEYYRRNVIGGPGSFLIVVEDFGSFAEGITKKLIAEIAAAPPSLPSLAALPARAPGPAGGGSAGD
jgi:hypothetical protein